MNCNTISIWISWRLRDIKNFFRYGIPCGVRNLIRWFPVIWNDRNWDQYYIYIILRKKLKLTEKTLRNGHHLYADRTADQIKVCIFLLNRLIKDEYHMNAFKRHNEKWGETEFEFEKIKDRPGYSSLKITHPNVKTEKDKKLQKKDFKRASDHVEYLTNQDVEMLFRNMNKYIRGWWD
jgi:hypothetical protein